MKLLSVIKDCELISHAGLNMDMAGNTEILSIESNSAKVKPGTLFIAVKGFMADGHDFIDQAFEKGASAVIAQYQPGDVKMPENIIMSDRILFVKDSRLAMASVADNFYGHPSKAMTLIGITGTNGKTTTTWILENILKTCGFSTGVIGTVNIRYSGRTYDNPVTTPDSIDLQKTLYKMKTAGITHVIMEVSSHGLDLKRVDFCNFNVGVFTNLSQDHLDYHKNMDDYFNCKKRLFTRLLRSGKKQQALAVLNIDDTKGGLLSKSLDYKTVTVSIRKGADISARDFENRISGLCGTLCMPDDTFKFESSLIGKFNLENILCAAGAAHALNINQEHIKNGIKGCDAVPGRLEKISNSIDRFLFVDYAHTPDALESVLRTVKEVAPKRVITVFGCGGDRDRSKRAVMGKIACTHSNIAIVSSDNPRTENPDSIIEDIIQGLHDFPKFSDQELSDRDPESFLLKNGYIIERDRKKAIKKALSISRPGDIIIAAGKGHETYQITKQGTIHFDDREELENAALKAAEKPEPIAWTIDDLTRALECRPLFSPGKKDYKFTKIVTDSRSIEKTDLFCALKGENFNGHTFINELLQTGIKGFITQKGYVETLDKKNLEKLHKNSVTLFEVENTLTALGRLARHQRIRSKARVVAITGSSGKTTTRQITEEIFKTRFCTLATQGNFNNEIGLPLTLLNLSFSHEWAIVEMGMNHAGEISRLTGIALPDIAIVTNTAEVHLEGLESVKNVAKAKAEIFEGLNNSGTAVIPGSDPRRKILETKAKENINIKNYIYFGSDQNCDISANDIKTKSDSMEFAVTLNNTRHDFTINSPALFMVDNCLAAISAAMAAKIDTQDMKTGIKAFNPVSGRMDIYKLNCGINIIDDTYNANPASVTAALNTLKSMSKDRRNIAVLGDMLELGKESDKLHREIGRKAALLGINKLFIYGPQGKHTVKGALENLFPLKNIFHGSKQEIVQKVVENINYNTWLLIKGSRGMAMETIIKELKERLPLNFFEGE